MLPSPQAEDPQPPARSDTSVSKLSEPTLLHPSSVFFEAASHLRRFVIPAAIALLSAANGGFGWLAIAVVAFGVALLTTLIRYFTLRYRIQGNDFIVTEGLLFRRVRSVPIRRIQNVDLVQNVLHRIFGVAEVRIETASGSEPEATLRVLTQDQIRELREAIFGGDADPALTAAPGQHDNANASNTQPAELSVASSTGASSTGASTMGHARGANMLHRISLKQLALAGLASNRGTVLLGIVTGLYFQWQYSWAPGGDVDTWFDKSWLRVDSEQLSESVRQVAGPFGYVVSIIGGILLLLLCLRVFGVAWYIWRFYDHQLSRHGDDLRISCGLFTKVSATIPRKRIQFISIHRSLLMRWMKLAAIRVETAGGGDKTSEDAAATVSRRWFLPVIAEKEVPGLLNQLRPGLEWDEAATAWHAVSPLTWKRLLRFAILASVVLSVLGLAIFRPWGALIGLVCFPLLAFWAIKKSRSVSYARTPWGVAYKSGLFTKKLSLAFYDRMQTLALKQSPFDRRWKMAELCIDTAAAGPADHLIQVAYLDANFAATQFEDLQKAAAEHRPSWA